MIWPLFFAAGGGGAGDPDPDGPDEDHGPDEKTMRARRLLEDAVRKERPQRPAPGGRVGQQVDKYFGTKLPPVCARLGCYVTDDGKRFYCVNPSCQKHKKRETKHTRRGRPTKSRFVYFRCPRCSSKEVDMHLLTNKYACRTCRYVWER